MNQRQKLPCGCSHDGLTLCRDHRPPVRCELAGGSVADQYREAGSLPSAIALGLAIACVFAWCAILDDGRRGGDSHASSFALIRSLAPGVR